MNNWGGSWVIKLERLETATKIIVINIFRHTKDDS